MIIDIFIILFYYSSSKTFYFNNQHVFKSDVGVVFFGDFDSSKKTLGDDTLKRLDHAIKIYYSKKIDNIICVGGARKSRITPGSYIMRDYLIYNGIRENNIFCDSLSFDTRTNWLEASKIIQNNKFSEITLISSPLHLFRIDRMINKKENIYYSPYLLNETKLDYFGLLRTLHHEISAIFFLAILPEKIYHRLLKYIRG